VGGIDARGKTKLTWILSPVFTSVRVFRQEEGAEAAFRPLVETKENSWLDDTVQPGRTYRYRLAGVGPDGRVGRPSAELVVRIGAAVLLPPAPPDWDGYLPVEDGVGLKWSAREGEDVLAWNIYRKSPPETEFRLVGSSRGTSYHDVGLEPDRQYLYVLTALDSSFRETPFSRELSVRLAPRQKTPEPQRPAAGWVVRRTRLVALVVRGGDFALERPADVAVGPVSQNVYLADSGRNLVFVFTPRGVFQRTVGANQGGGSVFKNLLGLATDRNENLYVADAGSGAVQVFSPQGRLGRRIDLSRPAGLGATGLIDAAIGPDGRIHMIDNYNNRVSTVGPDGAPRIFGQAGAKGGEFSAPTFCAVDAAGNLYVSDCLNARVQVFTGSGEFVRAFGRADRGPGGFGRPKGVAVSAAGEIYVADSWMNTVQLFDAAGRFVAILGDEAGRPLDLGSPNGVALGPGNLIYVAERLAARLQIRELIGVP
jgi:sugar lactone lactonase YvrE